MKNKTFVKGIVTGVMSTVITVFAINSVMHIISANSGEGISVGDKMNYISSLLETNYVDEVDREILVEGAYRGMVESLGDPYTSYMTKDEAQTFFDSTQGSFYGIGINVLYNQAEDALEVISPIEGLSAQKAGVLPGDIIVKVNENDVVGMDTDAVISLIKGEEGTFVNVTFKRGNEFVDYDLERVNVETPSVAGEIIEGNIGYIDLTGFKSNTFEQFEELYDEFMEAGIKGLVIDVRNNPGGVLDVVVDIADKLVPEGTIVYTIDRAGERIDYTSEPDEIEIPLVILVNESSASASEVLSGAVQDMGAGVLVGTQTFGKGLVQMLYPLPDGSAVKVTIQEYYTPNGVCIQGEGLAPDYVVEMPEGKNKYNVESLSEDTQLMKAIEIINQ